MNSDYSYQLYKEVNDMIGVFVCGTCLVVLGIVGVISLIKLKKSDNCPYISAPDSTPTNEELVTMSISCLNTQMNSTIE